MSIIKIKVRDIQITNEGTAEILLLKDTDINKYFIVQKEKTTPNQ